MTHGGVPTGFLTVTEAAAYLQVHPVTIRRWMADGRLPSPVKFPGKPACWPQSVIDAFVTGVDRDEEWATLEQEIVELERKKREALARLAERRAQVHSDKGAR